MQAKFSCNYKWHIRLGFSGLLGVVYRVVHPEESKGSVMLCLFQKERNLSAPCTGTFQPLCSASATCNKVIEQRTRNPSAHEEIKQIHDCVLICFWNTCHAACKTDWQNNFCNQELCQLDAVIWKLLLTCFWVHHLYLVLRYKQLKIEAIVLDLQKIVCHIGSILQASLIRLF